MSFREYLKSSIREEVIRKDKSHCELELKDGNNIFIEKRNGKYNINCTKPTLCLSKLEVSELLEMLQKLN